MRDVAVISYSQRCWQDAGPRNEVEMILPTITEAKEIAGVSKDEIDFTCSGSCDYLTGCQEGALVEGVVEVIEPVGPEIILNVRCSDKRLVARVDPRVETDIGEEIQLTMDMDKMHIFRADPPHLRIGD